MAWIGAAVGAAGGLLGGMMNSSSAQQINEENIQLAQQEEQWQTQMSNTAEQRHVADLKAAGLNPALAYGTPAPVPSAAPLPNVVNPRPGDSVSAAVQNGVTAYQQQAQAELTSAQAAKVRVDTAAAQAQLPWAGATAYQTWSNLKSTEDNLNATFDNLTQDTANKMDSNTRANQMALFEQQLEKLNVQRAALGMPRVQNDATWQKAHPDISGWIQSGLPDAAGKAIDTAVNSASKLFPADKVVRYGKALLQ